MALAGEIIQAGAVVVRKITDEIVSNSAVLQNDNELSLSVPANAAYRFELQLRYVTNSAANLKWSFTLPSGALVAYSALHVPAGGTALVMTEFINNAVGTADDSATYVRMLGQFETTATAGTLQLQWAQNTAAVFNTTVQAVSFMNLDRIG